MGSYGEWAEYKAEMLNDFVRSRDIASVIEWGCGDGNQLSLAQYPRYLGLDVSQAAVRRCMSRFGDDPTKSFMAYDAEAFEDAAGFLRADLSLSLDVIYHLVEDAVLESYLRCLFRSAYRYVVVYSTNEDRPQAGPHVRHREFLPWVAENLPDWTLADRVERPEKTDPQETDFFIFERR
jgi:hypothetical protein